jgi:hypothetical protein
MTLRTLREGFALMGASLSVTEDTVMVDYRGVTILISLSITDKELEGILFFLNLNTPNWYRLVKQALAEERKEVVAV